MCVEGIDHDFNRAERENRGEDSWAQFVPFIKITFIGLWREGEGFNGAEEVEIKGLRGGDEWKVDLQGGSVGLRREGTDHDKESNRIRIDREL